ncbi:MAG: hypothetical protein LJF04_03655 [Gemmatimonadetes bacterium]|nr:hypothetical protein [Gemmatimonadota bacterium]
MTTKTMRAALAAGLLAMGAASVQAQTPSRSGATIEVRVVNNYASAVRVYVEDRFGQTESLGWVNRADARTLTVPASITKLGPVQIRVFSNQPVWSPRTEPEGIQTRALNLRPGDVVNFWLQDELVDSYIQLVRT